MARAQTKRNTLSIREPKGVTGGKDPVTTDPIPEKVADVQLVEGDLGVRDVMDNVRRLFDYIGSTNETRIPSSSKNNSNEAAEYALADSLYKMAEERKKQAFEAAKAVGVFGSADDWREGDTVVTFNDPNFVVSVKKGRPSRMINKEFVQEALERHLGKKAPEVLEECLKERAGTTQYIVSIMK